MGMRFTDVNAMVTLMLIDAYRRYALGDDYTAMAMERLAKTLKQIILCQILILD